MHIGGAGFSNNLLSFLTGISGDYILQNEYMPYLMGYDEMREVNTFLGVRYIIHDKSSVYLSDFPYAYKPFGYEKKYEDDRFYIIENQYYLPIAFTYDSVISEDDYSNLSKGEKRLSLLQRAVVGNDSKLLLEQELVSKGAIYSDTDEILKEEVINASIKQSSDRKKTEINLHDCPNQKYLVLEADTMNDVVYERLLIRWGKSGEKLNKPQNGIFYSSLGGNNVILLEFPSSEVDIITIESTFEPLELNNVMIYQVDDSYFSDYINSVEARKANPFTLNDICNGYLSGEISLDTQQLLCITLENEDGWSAFVDGKEAEIHTINQDFIGVMLDAGEHTVELFWEQPDMDVGIILLTIGCIIWLFILRCSIQKSKLQ